MSCKKLSGLTRVNYNSPWRQLFAHTIITLIQTSPAIPDNFPKIVISMDEVAGGSYQGIQHLHIEDFLISITGTKE